MIAEEGGLSINNYSNANHSNIVVQFNTFYNGYHTTSLDVETGTNTTGNTDSVIFRNNLVCNNLILL